MKAKLLQFYYKECHPMSDRASASSPSEFRFGPLQVMPIWGTVTWPDGRVFDGRFENGKPLGQ